MLYRELLQEELKSQSDGFVNFAREQAADLRDYLEKLNELSHASHAELSDKLGRIENVGALPSEELDAASNFAFPFDESWANHEEARVWAFETLNKRTTFAADGSQLFIEREVSLPVAAVQIGWFENPHDDAQGYEKNAKFFVLSPEDLLKDQEEPVIPETRVGQRRFEAEVEKAEEFLQKKKGWQARGERMPLAFFDGTLLISFALPRTELQESFIRKMVGLVKVSRETRVPLVGYVDRSYARDLLGLLDAFHGTRNANKRTVDDASMLHASISESAPTLQNWGDRTVFCYSKRRGLKAFIDDDTGKSIVGFCYLQTTSDNPPARLDIPAWIYEENLLDEVTDTIRAECVVGLGYPYALETADQTAVINLRDREVFLQALQGFAKRNNLDFRFSRKGASKGRRR
ncbi:MAG: DNA double-strand break repair nuclease NurA [Pyrinomonadaceae bacterium]|nr:DNA double-strand break repair nuclease NurA [Pyrinomonadaceae bacterium]